MSGLNNAEQQRLKAAVDKFPETQPLGIAFVGRGLCQLVRDPELPEGFRTWMVIVEDEGPLPPGPVVVRLTE